ncbi:Serine/threonine-protein kinase stk11, partial [Cladochytrium tenue]
MRQPPASLLSNDAIAAVPAAGRLQSRSDAKTSAGAALAVLAARSDPELQKPVKPLGVESDGAVKARYGETQAEIQTVNLMRNAGEDHSSDPEDRESAADRYVSSTRRIPLTGKLASDDHTTAPSALRTSAGSISSRLGLRRATDASAAAHASPRRVSIALLASAGFEDGSGSDKPVLHLYPKKSVSSIASVASRPHRAYSGASARSASGGTTIVRDEVVELRGSEARRHSASAVAEDQQQRIPGDAPTDQTPLAAKRKVSIVEDPVVVAAQRLEPLRRIPLSASAWTIRPTVAPGAPRSSFFASKSLGSVRPAAAAAALPSAVDADDGRQGAAKRTHDDDRPAASPPSLRYRRPGAASRSKLDDTAAPSDGTSAPRTASRAALDYYEYLQLAQRHASSNFIHRIASADLAYADAAPVKIKSVGPYLLGAKIGKGAFAKVKEGVCIETLQRVAVKIINKRRLRRVPNGVENTLREIRMLRRLKHANVVTLVDTFCKAQDDEGNAGVFAWSAGIEDEPLLWSYDDGSEALRKVQVLKWYLVFEFCPCSLQSLIDEAEGGRLPEVRAHSFFTQLIDGIEYLHSRGIIHRDIKPGNMLVTADDVLKIADLGVAEEFSAYECGPIQCDTFAGTHQFLAPEVVEGVAKFDGSKVDVWAAGVTLFNMLTGRYPFESEDDGNLLDLYDKISTAALVLPPELDPDLAHLLQGMLARDPAARLAVAEIKVHPWTLRSMPAPPPPLRRESCLLPPVSPTPDVGDDDADRRSSRRRRASAPVASDTTLVPFLEALYADELRAELEQYGRFVYPAEQAEEQ